MLLPGRFAGWIAILLIARCADLFFTYQYTPDLALERNPLVVATDGGWWVLLGVQLPVILVALFLMGFYERHKERLMPKARGLTPRAYWNRVYQRHDLPLGVSSEKSNPDKKMIFVALGFVLPRAIALNGIVLAVWAALNLRFSDSAYLMEQMFYFKPWVIVLAYALPVLLFQGLFYVLHYRAYCRREAVSAF